VSEPTRVGDILRQITEQADRSQVQEIMQRAGWNPIQLRVYKFHHDKRNPVEQYYHALVGRPFAKHPQDYASHVDFCKHRALSYVIEHPPVEYVDGWSPDRVLVELNNRAAICSVLRGGHPHSRQLSLFTDREPTHS
jgi:hypothetical protein